VVQGVSLLSRFRFGGSWRVRGVVVRGGGVVMSWNDLTDDGKTAVLLILIILEALFL